MEGFHKNVNIEEYILKKLVVYTIVGILPYVLFNIFIDFMPSSFWRSIAALIVFVGFNFWLTTPNNFKIKSHVIAITLLIGVITGFMTMGGLKSIPTIDLINSLFFIALVFSDITRTIYLIIMAVIVGSLFTITMIFPHLIFDIRQNDPLWFTLFQTSVRLVLTLNIGLAMKDVLTKENTLIKKLLVEVNQLNGEISKHNIELQNFSERLRINNESLEKKVKERTATLESKNQRLMAYSFMNSHLFRAPIARLKGIIKLISVVKQGDERKKLEGLLHDEVNTIDNLTYKISLMINEVNSDQLERIVIEAEKIYKETKQRT